MIDLTEHVASAPGDCGVLLVRRERDRSGAVTYSPEWVARGVDRFSAMRSFLYYAQFGDLAVIFARTAHAPRGSYAIVEELFYLPGREP